MAKCKFNNRLLVVGVGRSGTTYVKELFQHLGFRPRKEKVTPFEPEMKADVEVSWPAGAILAQIPKDVKIVHLVRHPILTIRRFMYMFFYDIKKVDLAIQCYNKVWPGRAFELPLNINKDMEICCEFYCRWNKAIQESERVDLFVRLEQIKKKFYEILKLMGAQYDPKRVENLLKKISKETNTATGIINRRGPKNKRIKGGGLFKNLGFDDVTKELQDYIIELGYNKNPKEGIRK